MLAFELTKPTTVKLSHAKGRKEMHGDVKVLAVDLSITLTTNNRFLDTFAPGWREALFCALPPGQEPPPDQGALDLRVSDLAFLRMPHAVYPIRFDREFSGTLRMDYGRGGEADKIVPLCKLKKIDITPLEGGSVEISFSASSAADIKGELVGVFSEYIQQDIVITLLAPNEVEGDLIDASKDGDAPGTEKAKEKAKAKDKGRAVTDAFIEQHAPAEGAGAAH